MVKVIRRTVAFTRISCVQVLIEHGVPRLIPGKDMIVFSQGLDREQATAMVRKQYGQDFTATAVVEGRGVWEMPVSDFVQYGHRVEGVALLPDDTDGDYDVDDDATDPALASVPTAPATTTDMEESRIVPTEAPGKEAPFSDTDVPPDDAVAAVYEDYDDIPGYEPPDATEFPD